MRAITWYRSAHLFAGTIACCSILVLSHVPASAMQAANLSYSVDKEQICGSLVIQIACNGACISKHYRRLMKMKVGDEMAWATARGLCGCKLR
jgi:hypothetical protein